MSDVKFSQCLDHPVLAFNSARVLITGGDGLVLLFRATPGADIQSAVGFQNGTWRDFPTHASTDVPRRLLQPASFPVPSGQAMVVGQLADTKQFGAGTGQFRFRMLNQEMQTIGCALVGFTLSSS